MLVAVVCAASGCGPADRFATEREIHHRPIEESARGFASSDTCRSCHPHQYATWYASYHRTMTQIATPQSVMGSFEDVGMALEGRDYQLTRRGDRFFVEMDDAAVKPQRVEREIVLVTGSHHFQFYWFATGLERKIGLFQFAYHIEEARWIPIDAMPLAPPQVRQATYHGEGRWNKVCSRCHSVGVVPRVDGDHMDTRVAEFGIGCEACHGPAAEHGSVNRNPLRRYRLHATDARDRSIVQPERLSHRISSQICGQCHSVNGFYSLEDQQNWMEGGYRYRPGDELERTRMVIRGDPEAFRDQVVRFWPDGVVRINGREYNALIDNPCYQRGEMSCLSCHSMHPEDGTSLSEWANDQLRPGFAGSRACTQCHKEFDGDSALVEHTRHPAQSSGSDCLGCHMPNTVYGLQKFTRSHAIELPDVATILATGRPSGCNLCHLDRTLEWTADHLEKDFGVPRPPIAEEDRDTAAGVRWLVSGDASQRAMMAWHVGWAPAREASEVEDWAVPYLIHLLNDRYAAVRYIAHRSLRELPGFEQWRYDYIAKPADRVVAMQAARQIWSQTPPARRRRDPTVLLGENGQLMIARFNTLLEQRDRRPMQFAE